MKLNRGFLLLSLFGVFGVFGVFGAVVAAGQETVQEAIPNWSAPATWTPAAQRGALHTMSAITSPLPFIGVTPCRLVDTRGTPGVPINTGGAFTANEVRTWTFTGLCGIHSSAAAVSLNVTVTNTGSSPFGFVKIWPGGGTEPNVSTLNWSAGGVTQANAAVVPLGTSPAGSVSVRSGNAGSDVIIDVNGYYAGAGVGIYNTFLGLFAGNFSMTGDFNTGIGYIALSHNTTGANNTSVGGFALPNNTMGNDNTAVGAGALQTNTTGNDNTAVGFEALLFNTGDHNTAVGASTLNSNTTGSDNTVVGTSALQTNTTGNDNTVVGTSALQTNTTGNANTVVGTSALHSNTTGSDNTVVGTSALLNATGNGNIALGVDAGVNLTAGDSNIYIGNAGGTGESDTMRIGTVGTQTATLIAGISVAAVAGSPVMVNSFGQLGVTPSSRRFKEDIREIAEDSDGLMRLHPVAFKYKPAIDPTGTTQYGLIAEDVAKVNPNLVGYDQDGQLRTVQYHLINTLLLSEVQKQHRMIESQQIEMEELKARLSRLEARLLAE